MTTRQLLISLSAIVATAALTDTANASDPATFAAPATAVSSFALDKTTLTPSDAELKRISNELRTEAKGALHASLQTALKAPRVVAD